MTAGARRGLTALWLALLPAGERDRRHDRLEEEVPTVAASWVLAIVQLGLIPVWALQAIAYAHRVAGIQSETILGSERQVLFVEAMLGSVALGPLAYVFSLQGLVLEYVIVTGVVRLAGLVASDRPTGDPIVSLLVWAYRYAVGTVRRQRRLRQLGPERPDRVVRLDRERLVVLCAREKPDWNASVTVQYGSGYYRLLRTEDRAHGPWVDIAYVLRPREAGELIRALVRLEEAPGATGAAAPQAGDD